MLAMRPTEEDKQTKKHSPLTLSHSFSLLLTLSLSLSELLRAMATIPFSATSKSATHSKIISTFIGSNHLRRNSRSCFISTSGSGSYRGRRKLCVKNVTATDQKQEPKDVATQEGCFLSFLSLTSVFSSPLVQVLSCNMVHFLPSVNLRKEQYIFCNQVWEFTLLYWSPKN